jgi:arsenate reductase
MAEGYLKSLDPELLVSSAGTEPAGEVNLYAIQVMNEVGIDISRQRSESVDPYLYNSFDYVITVCDHARETCPAFYGIVKHRLHIGFEDPANADGTDEEVLAVYRKVRDEIILEFKKFYDRLFHELKK